MTGRGEVPAQLVGEDLGVFVRDGGAFVGLALDRRQAEFTKPVWEYLDGAVSENRVTTGRQKAAQHGGTLSAIEARVLLLPSETDLYFRVADNAAELPHLRAGALRPIPSIWGHRAGSPAGIPEDLAFLKAAVHDWLNT